MAGTLQLGGVTVLEESGGTVTAPNNLSVTGTISGTVGSSSTIQSGTTFPAGMVLRVFYQTSTGDISVSSGTTIVTGVTQTLTPLSNTNKFLIMYSCNGRFNSGSDTAFEMQVYKGGSAIGGIAKLNNFSSGNVNFPCSGSGSFLDSPSTDSEITYDIRLALTFGSGSFQLSTGHSHMTIMEIAG